MGPNITLTKQHVPNYMFKYLGSRHAIERLKGFGYEVFDEITRIYWYPAEGVSFTPCLSILKVIFDQENPGNAA
ncbi:hypothetical protein NC651_040564 [Populus alba x Populus x berolinensis]|nr:hypothetical protein NC651_040564 [Populus alba x Populus x berolinensis]